MTARSLFIGGTSSNAGKSWMATAVCAWLYGRGVRVAPFKAQNMSNHSFPCRDGGEIGRAQVAQAEACGLEPRRAMNPILLKPNGDGTSQVVVNGLVWKTLAARDYYAYAEELRAHVLEAHAALAREFDVVVIEGAGSVSELNLRDVDLANLGLASRVGAPWLLVADIERGGVFASVAGTVGLLTPEERRLFLGFAINNFRGDTSLFEPGVAELEARTSSHCFGVFPHEADIHLDAEDGLSLDVRARRPAPPGARIAIVRLPHLSNPTDFRLLTWADWIVAPPSGSYDFIVLPGTKHTIADLRWLRESGLADWIRRAHGGGATVLGVCGGYQMLGLGVHDPEGHESRDGFAVGLGLLEAETTLGGTKTTRVVNAALEDGTACRGYEIHLGTTSRPTPFTPFATLEDGTLDGCREGRVLGTYLHGVLEDPAVVRHVFGVEVEPVSKADHYRRLADWFVRYGRGLDRLGV